MKFSTILAGSTYYAETLLDEKPFQSGGRVSVGWHRLAISNLKTVPYATNLFIWFGEHDLGEIILQRSMGTLLLSIQPPAPLVFIRGPEWSLVLTNTSGLSTNIPSDVYTIESRYAHWQQTDQAAVKPGQNAQFSVSPKLGAVHLTCNQPDAAYQLTSLEGNLVENGGFPASIMELPQGSYNLVATHHGHQRSGKIMIQPGATIEEPVDFNYGSALITSEPAGASVEQSGGGHIYGITPMTLSEVLPGTWHWTIRHDGYAPADAEVIVKANETTTFSTNLLSLDYVGSMNAARNNLALSNYSQAVQACRDALAAKPGDLEAIALQNTARGWVELSEAKTLAASGDYVGADRNLSDAQALLPDNEEITQLLAEYKPHEPEQRERERVNRLGRPKAVFGEVLNEYRDAPLFEEHVLKTGKPAREVAANIVRALQFAQPPFSVNVNRSPTPDTYDIEAMLELTGLLGQGTTSGRRECVIVCGQITDTETEIHYKVIEYKAETTIKFSVANLLNTATPQNARYIPIHPSAMGPLTDKMQARLNEGVSNLTTLIQGAMSR